MRRQAVTVAMALAAALAASTACGSSGGGSTAAASDTNFAAKASGTVNSWSFDNADDVGKARMKYADEQLKKDGASVKYDQTTFDSQKFTTRLASGDVPDVVQMDRQFVATYAAQGLIMPLDKCYSDNKLDPKTMFYKAVTDDVTYKGNIWAVPQFYQPSAIMLNGGVLKDAGVSNSDIDTSDPAKLLAAIGKMYKSNGNVPTTLGLDPQATGNAYLWVLGLGGQLTGKDGVPTLDNPANVYPLETLKKITDAQGGYAKVKSFTDSFDFFGAKNQFVKKQVGAEVDAQWYPNVLSPYTDQIQLQTVPFKDKNGNPFTVAGGTAFVIPAKAKNPVGACKWALGVDSMGAWQAAEQARVQTLKKNGGINTGLFTGEPAVDQALRKYVKPSGNADFDQTVQAFYDIVGKGKSIGASPAGQTINTDLINAITSTLLGQKSAKDALAQAQQDAMRAYNSVVK
jgi:multiple sugar transport system substrate-binding protein